MRDCLSKPRYEKTVFAKVKAQFILPNTDSITVNK